MPREPLFRRYRRFHKPDPARDVDEELGFHFAMRIEELMRAGMTEPQARAAAAERFGSLGEIRDECEALGRERLATTRRSDRWASFVQDLRYGLRSLVTNRSFALAVALTMAIGIGANSAVFSVAYGVLLRPLPYRDQQQLIRLWSKNIERGVDFFSVSPADFAAWREERTVLSATAAFERQRDATMKRTGDPESVQIAAVTPDIFPLLGTSAAHGRTLMPPDAQPGAPPVVVLRHDLWSARFGADPAVIGQDLTIDGRRVTIAGVMPARFSVPGTPAQLWTALDLTTANADHSNRYLRVLARLAPGATLEDAQARLDVIARRLAAEFPATNGAWRISSMSVGEMVIGRPFKRAVQVLMGVVALVLLIACANAANLQLARGAARRRDIAIRSALGAGRGRIARQMLSESILLGVIAGGAGLLLAYGGVVLLRTVGETTVPRLEDVRLDAPVLIFTTAITLLSGLLFGLVPAVRASRADAAEVLKEGGRSGGAIGNRTRAALIISEVALSLVLLIGAGLLIRSFARLQDVSLGFEPAGVSLAPLRLPEDSYATPERLTAFWNDAIDRARAQPGVVSAALVSSAPFAGGNTGLTYIRADRSVDPQTQPPDADFRVVSPGYLQTMGIRLTRGRDFSTTDQREAARIILVSEVLAREAWPGEDAVGKGVRLGNVVEGSEYTVIGVVDDVRYQNLDAHDTRPMMYFPSASRPQRTMTIAFRGTDPALGARVRDAVSAIDPSLPPPTVTTLGALVDEALATPRFALVLFAVFAGVALVLAAIGIYGVMSYLVRQRTQEMGIRIALGAPARSIVGSVVGRAMSLTVIGVAAGLLGALWLTRFTAALLFGVSATDPLTYAVFAVLLCSVAALGSLVPALRATRADPLEAMRGVEKRPG